MPYSSFFTPSAREQEVCFALAKGLADSEIALFQHIYEKVGVRGRAAVMGIVQSQAWNE